MGPRTEPMQVNHRRRTKDRRGLVRDLTDGTGRGRFIGLMAVKRFHGGKPEECGQGHQSCEAHKLFHTLLTLTICEYLFAIGKLTRFTKPASNTANIFWEFDSNS